MASCSANELEIGEEVSSPSIEVITSQRCKLVAGAAENT